MIVLYPNIDYLNVSGEGNNLLPSDYLWVDAWGDVTELSDGINYVVLRDGIHGFSGSSNERALTSTPLEYTESVNHRTAKAREFGFEIMILAPNHELLMLKRERLLRIFSAPGTLQKRRDDGTLMSIRCYAARGSPSVSGGLPAGNYATHQQISISLIAPDPYWYGDEITVTRGAGLTQLSIVNAGNTEFTPAVITLSSNTAANITTGQTIAASAGKTVSGSVVSVDDNGVTASLSGTNVVGRFTINSQFFGLTAGLNVLEGVSSVKYTPRWDGI